MTHVVTIRNRAPSRIKLTQRPGVGPPGNIENFSVNGAAPFHFTGSIPGSLVVAAGTHRFYPNRVGKIGTIDVSMGTAPEGADAIFDVNLNGGSIFTTQLNRPTIASGTFFTLNNVPDVVDFGPGDFFTFDCDQRGTSTWGGSATMILWYF